MDCDAQLPFREGIFYVEVPGIFFGGMSWKIYLGAFCAGFVGGGD